MKSDVIPDTLDDTGKVFFLAGDSWSSSSLNLVQ